MDNLGEMRTAVQSDFTVGNESSLITPTAIDLAINRAYRKIGAMFKWTETKDALKTVTRANKEWYDYPQNWRPETIWKLVINSQDFGEPLTFKDYQHEKENSNPSGLQRMWANWGKKYFVDPAPTEANLEIDIFGYKFVDKLTVDGDITIFSYSIPNINEAIVIEAGEILKNKADIAGSYKKTDSGSILLSGRAMNMVMAEWAKVSQENSKNQNTTPRWDVPDFFARGVNNENAIRNKIGNF